MTKESKIILFIITILLIIYAIIIDLYCNKVNAEELATSDFPRYSVSTGTSNSVIDNIGNHFTNKGEGTIMFTFVNHPGQSGPSLYSLRAIANDGVAMPCDLGTASYFRDSGTQNVIYTAKCYVNLTNKSLNRLQWQFNSTGQIIYYGTSMQFIPKGWEYNQKDYSAYIGAINYNAAVTATTSQNIQGLIEQIKTNIATNNENMINAIQNMAQQQHNDYNEFKNSDISNQTKQNPNQQEYDNVKTKENSMYEFVDNGDINILDLGDTTGWQWVLTKMTQLINTHTMVMTMFISILTIGVMKQLLGR